jgi:Family of unknown function (DUF6152)
MNRIAKTCTTLLLTAAGTAVLAHHSGAMFDPDKQQTLVGTITEFNWVNPHSSFKVSVKAADGAEKVWSIEMNGPQNLVRLGWKRTTIKAGDKVSVVVHPLRDGKPGGSFVAITLPDGKTLTGTGPGQNNSYPAEPAAR